MGSEARFFVDDEPAPRGAAGKLSCAAGGGSGCANLAKRRRDAGAGGRLFPSTPVLRNLALHLRDRLKRSETLPGWTDHPRAALQRALVAALAEGAAAGARRLGVAEADVAAAYARWWGRYN